MVPNLHRQTVEIPSAKHLLDAIGYFAACLDDLDMCAGAAETKLLRFWATLSAMRSPRLLGMASRQKGSIEQGISPLLPPLLSGTSFGLAYG